jgi:ribosome maturation factor RimP
MGYREKQHKPSRQSAACVHTPGTIPLQEGVPARVWDIAEPLCLAEGLELVHVEYAPEAGGRTLRLYIDKAGGVNLDDCVNISRQLNDLLDIELDMPQSYRLEVSSPGQERPLGRVRDFETYKGHQVRIKTRRPIDGRKTFTGILAGFSGDNVELSINSERFLIPYQGIARARLVYSNGENRC